jgi:transposase
MPRYIKPRKTWMYTNAFKIKAVKLTLQDGFKVKQVAQALDIHQFMLSRWRKEYRDGNLKGAIGRRISVTTKKKTPSSKQISDYERLKRENAKFKEENDLLKKWQRYLAEQHQNDLGSSKDTDT